MKNNRFPKILCFFCILIFFLTGCQSMRPKTDPLLDKEAFSMALDARQVNQDILTSKGFGFIRLKTSNGTDHFSIAWAAKYPNKLRVVFMLSGHPVETIIATGKEVSFVSHTGQHPDHVSNSADPDLDSYIDVPIKLSDIVSILLGRFPVKQFDDAYFDPTDPTRSTIALRQQPDGLMQRLYFTPDKKLHSLAPSNFDGNSTIKLKIIKTETHATHEIPVHFEVHEKSDVTMSLNIRRFIPNPPIKESVFLLTDKGNRI